MSESEEETLLFPPEYEEDRENLTNLFRKYSQRLDELNFHHYSAFRAFTLDSFVRFLLDNEAYKYFQELIKTKKVKPEEIYNLDNWVLLLHNKKVGEYHYCIKLPMKVIDVKNKHIFEAGNQEMMSYYETMMGLLSTNFSV